MNGLLWFSIDYSHLSNVTVMDTYLLPCMYEHIDSLHMPKIFRAPDAISGFRKIPVKEENRKITVFVCFAELCRYACMTLGLIGARATFQRALNVLLSDFIWKTCFGLPR